jgi:hypothetical protein
MREATIFAIVGLLIVGLLAATIVAIFLVHFMP